MPANTQTAAGDFPCSMARVPTFRAVSNEKVLSARLLILSSLSNPPFHWDRLPSASSGRSDQPRYGDRQAVKREGAVGEGGKVDSDKDGVFRFRCPEPLVFCTLVQIPDQATFARRTGRATVE